ncbi:MAG: hypothetical protein H7101_10095, partial [Deinococcales bacterium]|nr:hypothetical protein [Chitinophagaceae bacterium]
GLCAVTLSIEAAFQQFVPLNHIEYYVLVFAATVLYYTYAYISINTADLHNKRSVWYVANKKAVIFSQIFFTLTFIVCSSILLKNSWQNILKIPLLEWGIILVFPIVSAFYYGINLPIFQSKNLRSFGWLKPFFIGFVWAGLVTVYPIIFYHISTNTLYEITLLGCLLFIKNFMFVTVLCIMFDIKDYAADHNHQLKTFVVRVGLRKTIFYIIMPLCIIGLATFIFSATMRHFSLLKISINTIPFILLIIVAYSLHRRKSILYYLAIIDGLLLIKSICGIIGVSLIK